MNSLYKKLFILIAFLSLGIQAFAQVGMSDEQLIQFLIEQKNAGVSESQLVPKLLERGVRIEQIQRVRQMYERQKNGVGAVNGTNGPQAQADQRQRGLNRAGDNNFVKPNNVTSEETVQDELSFMDIDSLVRVERLKKEFQQNQIFGHNIFNNKNLTFEPNQNMPTPSNYRIGAGDKVFVDVWGASQKTFEGTVSPDGTITIENVGPVKLAGLTVREATKKLRGVLGRYYSSSQISLTLGETRSIQVQVMGEVKTPGTYTLSALSTAFNALYAAGGIGELGTLRDIKVMRGGRQIATIDIYDFILNGVLSGNVRLQDNDVIVVGSYKTLVCLRGKVKRPMFYEMRNNETLSMLIDYAGGFSGDAYRKNVRLIRPTDKEYAIYNVDEFDMPSFTMQDGDSVYVDSVLQRYSNMAELKGAVMYPGNYQINGTAYTLRGLIEAASGLREDAYAERVVIYRQKEDLTTEAISVNLKNVLSGVDPDVPLKKNDKIVVQSKLELIGRQTIEILGEVNFPGEYLYADNMSIRDVILQAGGTTDAASHARVDVYRRVTNKNAMQATDTIAQVFNLDMADGLSGKDGGFVLQPNDKVMVRKSPDYMEQQTVTVKGCVNFEGTFAMESNNYKLTDIIAAAGGLTDVGYAKGARLERRLTYEERKQRQTALRAQQIALYEESMTNTDKNYDMSRADSLLTMKLGLGNTYYVAIDLDAALKNPNGADNIVLRNGDVLTIPQYSSTVKISGDVMYPSSINFKEGETLSYYIDRAGGYGESAKKRKTYIIYQNGSVQMAKRHYKKAIQPGCEIVVPSKNNPNKMTIQESLSIGTTSASIATMMVSIANMLK